MVLVKVTCDDIGAEYAEFCAQIDHNYIDAAIDITRCGSIEENRAMLDAVQNAITKYDKDTLRHHWLNKTETFVDWCENVVCYYVYRFVLFDKPIPIC